MRYIHCKNQILRDTDGVKMHLSSYLQVNDLSN